MHRTTPPRIAARGFSLPELLVAVAVGLPILAGMTTLFVRNSRAQSSVERANRQIENGRYAIDVISTDLRNAGYYGEYDPTELPTPPGVPDPCALTLGALQAALPLHVQGYRAGATMPSCLSDQKSGTDVLVARHTRACVKGDPNCDASDPDGPLFQASLCNNPSELGSGNAADHYALDTDQTRLTRHARDCTQTAGSGSLAPVRRLLTHIYFIANNDNDGDGIPTLKRAELRLVDGNLRTVIVPLVEGIETLQLQYGMDTNNDGVVDTWTATPDSANACAQPDCAAANWRNVMAVRLHVLARSPSATPGYTDTKTYVVGTAPDGTARTAGPFTDGRKRHVFQTVVSLSNPVGRKQP
jgi:type IV pilus assembly protein PilW